MNKWRVITVKWMRVLSLAEACLSPSCQIWINAYQVINSITNTRPPITHCKESLVFPLMNGLDDVFWLWQRAMLDAFHLKKFKNIKPGFSNSHFTKKFGPKYSSQAFENWFIKPFTAIDISKRYNDFDPEIEAQKVFEDSVTTFPVHDEQMMFKLHKKYSEVEIDVTYRNISKYLKKSAKLKGKINILNLFVKM